MSEKLETGSGDLFDKAGMLSTQSGELLQYLDRIENALDRIRPEDAQDKPDPGTDGPVAQDVNLWQKLNSTIRCQEVALNQASGIVQRLERLV